MRAISQRAAFAGLLCAILIVAGVLVVHRWRQEAPPRQDLDSLRPLEVAVNSAAADMPLRSIEQAGNGHVATNKYSPRTSSPKSIPQSPTQQIAVSTPPTKVQLTGLVNLDGINPKALLVITEPDGNEARVLLAEGAKSGVIEVLKNGINQEAGTVKILNNGVAVDLSFQKDGVKPSANPSATLPSASAPTVVTTLPVKKEQSSEDLGALVEELIRLSGEAPPASAPNANSTQRQGASFYGPNSAYAYRQWQLQQSQGKPMPIIIPPIPPPPPPPWQQSRGLNQGGPPLPPTPLTPQR